MATGLRHLGAVTAVIFLGLVGSACGAIVPAMAPSQTVATSLPDHCAPTVPGRMAPRLVLVVVIDQFRADDLHDLVHILVLLIELLHLELM